MRPIFTRLQKKRQRISPDILDLIEDSGPSAKRVARLFGLRDCCKDVRGKEIRQGSKVRVLHGPYKGSEGIVVLTETGERLPFDEDRGSRVTLNLKKLVDRGKERYFQGLLMSPLLAYPEHVQIIPKFSPPRVPVEPTPSLRLDPNRTASSYRR